MIFPRIPVGCLLFFFFFDDIIKAKQLKESCLQECSCLKKKRTTIYKRNYEVFSPKRAGRHYPRHNRAPPSKMRLDGIFSFRDVPGGHYFSP